MLRFAFNEQPVFQVNPDLIRLERDSFERQLRDALPRLVRGEDFKGWWSSEVGAPTCCPIVLSGMLLLQRRYNLSDEALEARCRRDLGFKYALGLDPDAAPPSASTVKRFRKKLRSRLGDDFLQLRVLKLAIEDGLLDDAALQAADSTNTDCRGAVIDTFNLIGAGIRQVIRVVAKCLGTRPEDLARQWGMHRYMARSMKGAASIDWNDESARNALLTLEVTDADRLPAVVGGLCATWPADVAEALELLRKVAHQDVEQTPDGTWRIAKGTTPGRVISMTDPEARHGRKSSSKVINGFKTHLIGTVSSQFVTGITVTNASVHDAAPTPELIRQTEQAGVKPGEVLADNAYGTGENRRKCAESGVALRTRLPAPSHKGALPKMAFDIDLEHMRVNCPAGQSTDRFSLVKDDSGSDESVPSFRFDRQTCQACDRRDLCCSEVRHGRGRTITLSVYERELQDAKAFARSDRAPALLRARSAVERLISHLVRFGMRHARFFGMHCVQFQAFMTAAAYNLQRIFTLTSAKTRFSTA